MRATCFAHVAQLKPVQKIIHIPSLTIKERNLNVLFFYEWVGLKFEGCFIQWSLLQIEILILCLTLFNIESTKLTC